MKKELYFCDICEKEVNINEDPYYNINMAFDLNWIKTHNATDEDRKNMFGDLVRSEDDVYSYSSFYANKGDFKYDVCYQGNCDMLCPDCAKKILNIFRECMNKMNSIESI